MLRLYGEEQRKADGDDRDGDDGKLSDPGGRNRRGDLKIYVKPKPDYRHGKEGGGRENDSYGG